MRLPPHVYEDEMMWLLNKPWHRSQQHAEEYLGQSLDVLGMSLNLLANVTMLPFVS
ncbi:hypothetical protein D3C75_1242840 [compost metagenome]